MSSGLRRGLQLQLSPDVPSPPPTFAIHGPIARCDLPGLSKRVCALLTHTRAQEWLCEVSGVAPDAVTVDALARLQLAARRHGCRIRLHHASPDLRALIDLMGLTEVLPD